MQYVTQLTKFTVQSKSRLHDVIHLTAIRITACDHFNQDHLDHIPVVCEKLHTKNTVHV